MKAYGNWLEAEIDFLMDPSDEVLWSQEGIFKSDEEYRELARKATDGKAFLEYGADLKFYENSPVVKEVTKDLTKDELGLQVVDFQHDTVVLGLSMIFLD
jgi:hypothetical protein